jgi:transcriptional regulator with XRE-family HTH domain
MRKAGKSKFDQAVVDRVKAMRASRNLSQDQLAVYLDVTRGFIGQCESPFERSKYNLNQLNRLAYEMKCSPREFIPIEPFLEKFSSNRKKQKK